VHAKFLTELADHGGELSELERSEAEIFDTAKTHTHLPNSHSARMPMTSLMSCFALFAVLHCGGL